MSNTFEKQTGIRHFIAAAGYSLGGFRRLLGESAFRQEALAFLAGIVLLPLFGAGFTQMLVFVALMLLLFAFEAINTAIEEIVDRVSPEYSLAAKHAKDLGSFACMCLIVLNGGYVLYTLYGLWFG
ncbi:diacylglycerol kinase [Gellertiella hungarica]|uniref:Diacylglycerol kinase n=1 Tax=Gellertiella hungarica TaxID=1572859 RepID=A0A7W6J4D1_9HYPH|nr:diacylglycerol kinase [Gellertiella hungarica]MBB4064543.1 diacylglycerol kinase (ATP) [Gellertiella hungarica]